MRDRDRDRQRQRDRERERRPGFECSAHFACCFFCLNWLTLHFAASLPIVPRPCPLSLYTFAFASSPALGVFEAKFIGAVPAEEISGAAVAEKGIADAKVRACVCVCVFVYVCAG